jgi:hypothetical protein
MNEHAYKTVKKSIIYLHTMHSNKNSSVAYKTFKKLFLNCRISEFLTFAYWVIIKKLKEAITLETLKLEKLSQPNLNKLFMKKALVNINILLYNYLKFVL